MRTSLTALTLLMLAPATVLARSDGAAAELLPGTRVRLTAAGAADGYLVGRLYAIDNQALTVITEDQLVRVGRERVQRVEVAWSRKRNLWKGLLLGVAAGAALFASGDPCQLAGPDGKCPTRARAMAEGAAGGGLLGVAVAAFAKSDRWVEVPLEANKAAAGPEVKLGLGPSGRRGVGLAVSVGF